MAFGVVASPAFAQSGSTPTSVAASPSNYLSGIGEVASDLVEDVNEFGKVFAESDSYYIAIESGSSAGAFRSGGFNTVGGFPNSGKSQDNASPFVGIMIGKEFGDWRLAFGGQDSTYDDIVTDSFPGPPGPIAFFYSTTVDVRSYMFHLYRDFTNDSPFTPYVGVGLGWSQTHIQTTDLVVMGSGSQSNLTYGVEAGVSIDFGKRVQGYFGYRYTDSGTTSIPLTSIVGGTSAGNYDLDIDAHALVVGIRIPIH
jgi:opacity protein-like surface antigen